MFPRPLLQVILPSIDSRRQRYDHINLLEVYQGVFPHVFILMLYFLIPIENVSSGSVTLHTGNHALIYAGYHGGYEYGRHISKNLAVKLNHGCSTSLCTTLSNFKWLLNHWGIYCSRLFIWPVLFISILLWTTSLSPKEHRLCMSSFNWKRLQWFRFLSIYSV